MLVFKKTVTHTWIISLILDFNGMYRKFAIQGRYRVMIVQISLHQFLEDFQVLLISALKSINRIPSLFWPGHCPGFDNISDRNAHPVPQKLS